MMGNRGKSSWRVHGDRIICLELPLRNGKETGCSILEEYVCTFNKLFGTYFFVRHHFGSLEYFMEQNKDLCSLMGHSRGWS